MSSAFAFLFLLISLSLEDRLHNITNLLDRSFAAIIVYGGNARRSDVWDELPATIPDSVTNFSPITIIVTYNPDKGARDPGYEFKNLHTWISAPHVLTLVGNNGKPSKDASPIGNISSFEECRLFYPCFYFVFREIYGRPLPPLPDTAGLYLNQCLVRVQAPRLACPFFLEDTRFYGPSVQTTCPNLVGGITQQDWDDSSTDSSLQGFLNSTYDANGVWWQGTMVVGEQNSTNEFMYNFFPNKTESFTIALGRQGLGNAGLTCSLSRPCEADINCRNAGSQVALEYGNSVFPESWVLYVLTSLQNINQQLGNQYVAIKGAAIGATLRTFSIEDFYPQPKKPFTLLDALQGLATSFSLFGGFIPGIGGKLLGQSANLVGAVGAELGRYVGSPSYANTTTAKFANDVEAIYFNFVNGLDNITDMLFTDEKIGGKFNITDMILGGAWVNNNSLQRVSETEEQLRIEILSRSVNQLWKTPPSNKIFTLFVSTPNCSTDTTGPPDLKYCGDGGVYYTYNFIEAGDGQGHLDWPWGGTKIKTELRLDPAWITEASARTYRLASTPGLNLDPFNYSDIKGIAPFLTQSLNLSLNDLGGRLPGSWTVPVCDAGTWGKGWNWNYINNTVTNYIEKFPCMCGPGGRETAAWVKAAGMLNFRTYYHTCKDELLDKSFTWPDGVTSVDFGFGDPIQRPK